MKKDNLKIIVWVGIYSIGMAFIESSVVVYLRALYYPEGFEFPLKAIDFDIGFTEFYREVATLIMLVSIGFIAAKTKLQRFAYFIYSFAVWDIFYYVFLKLLLNWPDSLLTWDILFILPVTWIGPVVAPVICSVLMFVLAMSIIKLQEKFQYVKIKTIDWLFLVIGSFVVIVSFTMDYYGFLNKRYSFFEIISYSWIKDSNELTKMYIPQSFNWWVFITGIVIIIFGIIHFVFRTKKQN